MICELLIVGGIVLHVAHRAAVARVDAVDPSVQAPRSSLPEARVVGVVPEFEREYLLADPSAPVDASPLVEVLNAVPYAASIEFGKYEPETMESFIERAWRTYAPPKWVDFRKSIPYGDGLTDDEREYVTSDDRYAEYRRPEPTTMPGEPDKVMR